MKLPVISLAILAGQIAFAWSRSNGTAAQAADVFQSMYTGYNFTQGAFIPSTLIAGYAPWLAKRFILPLARPRLGGMHLPVSLS